MNQIEQALREAGWVEIARHEANVGDEIYDLKEHIAFVVDAASSPACDWRVLRAPRPEPEYDPRTVVWWRMPQRTAGPQAFIRQDDDEYPWVGVDRLNEMQSAWRDDIVEVLRVIAYPDGSAPTDRGEASKVTRIEVIDETGRAYINPSANNVEYSFQDDGRTFTIFTGGKVSTPDLAAFRRGLQAGWDNAHLWYEDIDEAEESLDEMSREDLIEGMVPRVAEWGYSSVRNTKANQPGPHPPIWSEADETVRKIWEMVARHELRKAYEEATK